MELIEAKEILINYIKADRVMRDYNDTTDYEQQCEEKCVAIEVVLGELNRKKCVCPTDKTTK